MINLTKSLLNYLKTVLLSNQVICAKCGVSKQVTDFYEKKNKKSGYDATCKECRLEEAKERYQKNKLEWYTYLKDVLHIKCEICGYDKCIAALDFHHIDPDEKDFCVSKITGKALTKRSLKKVLTEMEKCMVLCARCHKEEHYLETERELFRQGA